MRAEFNALTRLIDDHRWDEKAGLLYLLRFERVVRDRPILGQDLGPAGQLFCALGHVPLFLLIVILVR